MAVREGIRAGIGVQLLPTCDGDADPNLVRVGPIQDDAQGLWLLTLPELKTATRVRAFMDRVGGSWLLEAGFATGVEWSVPGQARGGFWA